MRDDGVNDLSADPRRGGPGAARRSAVRSLDFYYRDYHALKDVNLDIPERRITSIIGPSGCGKSTLLRVFNRIYSAYADLRATGQVLLDGENILDDSFSLNRLRTRVGMVFQKAVPFPLSIYDNVAYGLRHHLRLSRVQLDERIEAALRESALWSEVKDKLQQQRAEPVGRPAAAPVHRPRRGAAPAGAAAGRADLRARPDRHRPHRAAAQRPAERLHHRHRHPQHAAGGARVGVHGLHVPGRDDRIRRHGDLFTRPQRRQTEDYITGRFG